MCYSLEERAVLACLRRMLHQIHPLDYEKIKYTCSWLLNMLAFSEEGEDNNDISTSFSANASAPSPRELADDKLSEANGKEVQDASWRPCSHYDIYMIYF